MTPRVETFEQFAYRTGGKTECNRFMLVNASSRSASMRKSAVRRRDQAWDRINEEIRATQAAYAQAIRDGEVIEPEPLTGIELTVATANGHPDNESVQAARRILAKRRASGHYAGPIPGEAV